MSIVHVAVRRPVTVAMFTLAVLLFGMVSLNRLAVTLLPDLSYPTLTIRTDYPGAAPAEIEQLINRPIEEALGTARGLSQLTSIARANQSDVILEFAWGTDMDMAGLEVREKLDMVTLPLDVEKPVILRLNPSMEPIIRLALALPANQPADSDTLSALRRYADEDLKRNLESTPGVASVRMGGGLEDEVQVLVDQDALSRLDIPMTTVMQRLREENINRAGGRIETERFDYLVRTLNQFRSIDDIRQVFIAERNGRLVQLQDIATVQSGAKDRTSITRLQGREAVEVTLYKEGDANTVAVADALQRRLPRVREQLPAGYELIIISDQSTFIASAIAEVKSNAMVGGALAMLVIFVFLRKLWPTIIVSLAIPVSIIAAFMLMHASAVSLNIMSLGGIALAVGLLVDNAIVVLENIARRRELGDDHHSAAIEGTREVAGAISASTLTTLAVFVPLMFVTGLAGQLFKDQALTVTFALLASLLVALTLIPMLAARHRQPATSSTTANHAIVPAHPVKLGRFQRGINLVWRRPVRWLTWTLPIYIGFGLRRFWAAIVWLASAISRPGLQLFDRGYHILSRGYARLLTAALKQRVGVCLAITAVALASYGLLPRLGTTLMPDMAQHKFYFDIELPYGSPIEQTDQVLSSLQQLLVEHPDVTHTYSIAGIGSLLNPTPNQGGDYWGRLQVVMQSHLNTHQLNASQQQLQSLLRQHLNNFPGVSARIAEPELFTLAQPMVIELAGYDLQALASASEQVVNALSQQSRFSDIQTTLRQGQPELEIRFDHVRLASLGLNAGDIGQLLALQVGGRVATQYNLLDRQIDIRVRLDEAQRSSVDDIENLIINPGHQVELPLRAVAEITRQYGPGEITRSAQQRVALVSASLTHGDLGSASAEVAQMLAHLDLPNQVTARVAGQTEAQQQAYQSLLFALALAIFLVYLVMASQFESLGHPLLIMFTLPLAGAGSVIGLWLTQTPLSVVVFIGLIMLAGIVVNNAIVLIDTINQLRSAGMEKFEAISQACLQRLRPIMMTTLTTILGLLPLAIGAGEGAEMRAPMAISVIFGLLFASLLTLVYIPVLYALFDRKRFVSQGDAA